MAKLRQLVLKQALAEPFWDAFIALDVDWRDGAPLEPVEGWSRWKEKAHAPSKGAIRRTLARRGAALRR